MKTHRAAIKRYKEHRKKRKEILFGLSLLEVIILSLLVVVGSSALYFSHSLSVKVPAKVASTVTKPSIQLPATSNPSPTTTPSTATPKPTSTSHSTTYVAPTLPAYTPPPDNSAQIEAQAAQTQAAYQQCYNAAKASIDAATQVKTQDIINQYNQAVAEINAQTGVSSAQEQVEIIQQQNIESAAGAANQAAYQSAVAGIKC